MSLKKSNFKAKYYNFISGCLPVEALFCFDQTRFPCNKITRHRFVLVRKPPPPPMDHLVLTTKWSLSLGELKRNDPWMAGRGFDYLFWNWHKPSFCWYENISNELFVYTRICECLLHLCNSQHAEDMVLSL
jgi:hypothetical protein